MLDQLKNLAMQRLQDKMRSNSLNDQATGEAANEGVGAFLDSIKGGDISQITQLLGSNKNVDSKNAIFQNLQGKLGDILQKKGMGADEAKNEASNTAQDLISGVKDRFLSTDERDKDFDISNITNLLGGNTGNIINVAKNLFGKR